MRTVRINGLVIDCADPEIWNTQEAMENFVFPDEIKTKLMKMSKLKNIFYVS